MNRPTLVLMSAAVAAFVWGALLSFSIVDNPDLREDTAGWLFVGLACWAVLSHPWVKR